MNAYTNIFKHKRIQKNVQHVIIHAKYQILLYFNCDYINYTVLNRNAHTRLIFVLNAQTILIEMIVQMNTINVHVLLIFLTITMLSANLATIVAGYIYYNFKYFKFIRTICFNSYLNFLIACHFKFQYLRNVMDFSKQIVLNALWIHLI